MPQLVQLGLPQAARGAWLVRASEAVSLQCSAQPVPAIQPVPKIGSAHNTETHTGLNLYR